ncbi:MAG: SRPBCC domain-containing protein [Chitinophagaceae bacterium]
MNDQPLEIKAGIQVLKPVHEVFEAIVDPLKMSNYFISESSGRMEENKELEWKFPEFDMVVNVKTGKIITDQYVSYYWDGAKGHKLLVEMTLTERGTGKTLVSISEKSMPHNEDGIKWLKQNTEGWANFLACLKAYLEYGINLRKGAFEFMSDQSPE